MTLQSSLWSGLRLMRPAQWPILTAQLAVGMLLTAPATGTARQLWWSSLDPLKLATAWLVWVIMLNGATLAFNSAYDRDTGPVAYLARPPLPPTGLATVSLLLMIIGCVFGLVIVGPLFGVVVGGSVVLSVLYSHPATRWKSRPGLDLVTNILGYGLGTTLAGLTAVGSRVPLPGGWWFAVGFGLLFGSFYPLTQIYQTAADLSRGDRTLTTALGVPRALVLALTLGVAGGSALLAGCHVADRVALLGLLVTAIGLWCGHLVWWSRHGTEWTDARHERGMYQALGLWGLVDFSLAVVWLVS